MPIVGGNYISPVWVDDNPPALNASEMQDITDTLANLDAGFGELIETGSYVGTGTYGAAHPCSITFGFAPTLLIVEGDKASASSGNAYYTGIPYLFTSSYLKVAQLDANSANVYDNVVTVSNGGKTISWYRASGIVASQQLNESGTTYRYIAIGSAV